VTTWSRGRFYQDQGGMFGNLLRAVGQLNDPAIHRVIALSIGATLALFLILLGLSGWLITHTALFQTGWLEGVADVASGLLALLLTWTLFPAVVVAVSSLMLEGVARSVEKRWYPQLGPARPQPLWEGIWNSIKFLGVVLLLNLLALPIYFVPVLGQLTYYSLNGYLLGREYYELVALRRLDGPRMRYLRSEGRLGLFVVGAIIAFISVVPFVNLLVPIVATAFMLHQFEAMRQTLPPKVAA